MSVISRTADLFYAYRFLKLLVTDWEDTKAYELGILDDKGKVLKKGSQLNTSEEKAAYTVFHRLVFNIKRLLNKLPFGRTKLASYATALFLIKEETGLSEEELLKVLKKMDVDFDELDEIYVPFTAYKNDCEPHSVDLFNRAVAGEFGPVGEYQAPSDIVGDAAINLMREQRNEKLAET